MNIVRSWSKMASVSVELLHKDHILSLFLVPLDKAKMQLAVVNLDRDSDKASSLNIIDEDFVLSMTKTVIALKRLAENGLIQCVVVVSSKESNFLAGADIVYELRMNDRDKVMEDVRKLNYALCGLESLPVPSVCLLNGTTLGGGLELALACDFRVADATNCRQIGLPEVQIGVLPGSGGCIRLPRLIGLTDAIQILVSGKSINAQSAYKIGLVDALFKNTVSQFVTGKDEAGMNLGWVRELERCISEGTIGKRSFWTPASLSTQCASQESVFEDVRKVFAYSREATESLLQSEAFLSEEKFQRKFPLSFLKSNSLAQSIVFTLAKRNIALKVGKVMPAPYGCLETVASCLKTATLREAIEENAKGFCKLVVTAESKCLMGLFLQTRKTQKMATKFGQDSEEGSLATESRTSDEVQLGSVCVVLPIAPGEEQQPGCFAQACLFSGIRVVLVEITPNDGPEKKQTNWKQIIEEEFDYAVKRGHWTKQKVANAIDSLVTCTNESDFSNLRDSLSSLSSVFIVSLSPTAASCGSRLLAAARRWPRIEGSDVCVVPVGNAPSSSGQAQTAASTSVGCEEKEGKVEERRSSSLSMSLFAPLRKSTQSVEIFSSGQPIVQHVRALATLVKMLRKLPILSNTHGVSVESVMLFEFWLFCCDFVVSLDLPSAQVDRVATSVSGFTVGPFKAMRQFGKENVLSLCRYASHYTSLKSFDSITSALSREERKPKNKSSALSDSDIDLCLKLACVKAAIAVKTLFPEAIEDETCDVLAVGGGMRFPPQEGGPICFLHRNGAGELKQKVSKIAQKVGNLQLFSSLIDALSLVNSAGTASTGSDFLWSELYSAGPCHGVTRPIQLPSIPWFQLLIVVVLVVLYVIVTLFL